MFLDTKALRRSSPSEIVAKATLLRHLFRSVTAFYPGRSQRKQTFTTIDNVNSLNFLVHASRSVHSGNHLLHFPSSLLRSSIPPHFYLCRLRHALFSFMWYMERNSLSDSFQSRVLLFLIFQRFDKVPLPIPQSPLTPCILHESLSNFNRRLRTRARLVKL